MKLTVLSILILISVVPFAFADTEYTIETADNDLTQPGCLETEIGCYTPNTLTVDVGHIVTMTNTDSTGIHTFTSGTVDGYNATPDGEFDSGLLQFGDSFEWTPNSSGEYPYYCMLHVWMQGMLIVSGNAVPEQTTIPEPVSVQESIPDAISSSVIVTTDKISYSEGELIVISGNVSHVVGKTPMIIQIFTSLGNIVDISQITVAQDGTFTKTFLADESNPLWQNAGEYIVRASYQDQIVETSFNFMYNGSVEIIIDPIPIPVKIPTENDNTLLKQTISNLQNDNLQLKVENRKLNNNNNVLQSQIEELNLKLINLQNIINEQIKVILEVIQDLKNK